MSMDAGGGWRVVAGLALATAFAATPSGADEIGISMCGGRVTLVATGVPLADILAEWSRVGATRFVGADTLGREPVTLRLVDAPEARAIGLLLRAAAGYVAAPRRAGHPGRSRYDRVTILATTGTSWPDPSADSVRSDAETSTPGSDSAAPPALVPLEELQRLLDAGDGDREGTAAGTPAAATDIPVMATPFPTIGALRNLSVTPGR